MKNIFEQGEFNEFRISRLDDVISPINESYQFAQKKTTVFISHKHEDLEDLKAVIGFLEKSYGIKVYIDSQDPAMPKITSGETASKIKERIVKCDKFILLATNGAIDSKWCNWELGYGDSQKYKEHIALFPMKPKNYSNSLYKGNEYMSIYPHIVQRNRGDVYSDGRLITPGYYVRSINDDGSFSLLSLEKWFGND